MRAVLDTAAEAIIIIDENGRIESANAATGKLFGYEAALADGFGDGNRAGSPFARPLMKQMTEVFSTMGLALGGVRAKIKPLSIDISAVLLCITVLCECFRRGRSWTS